MNEASGAKSGPSTRALVTIVATPAVAMFLSSNVSNAGNLLFNMLFGRWMGPDLFADLATLLTLKLSLLAVLNAVQMAVSQVVSGQVIGFGATSLRWLSLAGFVAMVLTLGIILPFALSGILGGALGIESVGSITILILALPFTIPLCIFRGVAVGRLDVKRMVWSTNLEMGVRLAGAVFFWKLGYGIEGVALAVALSILVGCLPVCRALAPATPVSTVEVLRPVLFLAFPFAVLQAAQVLHLDGDLLVANAILSPAEVSSVAVLSLFQRVQFFACFGLAAVLLPSVSSAALRGGSGLKQAAPVACLFCLVSVVVLSVISYAPFGVITVLVGPAFTQSAEVLPLAGYSAALFTFSYLCATYLAALDERSGIWLVAAFLPLQLCILMLLSMSESGLTLPEMMRTKLLCQIGLSVSLIVLIVRRSRSWTTSMRPQKSYHEIER